MHIFDSLDLHHAEHERRLRHLALTRASDAARSTRFPLAGRLTRRASRARGAAR